MLRAHRIDSCQISPRFGWVAQVGAMMILFDVTGDAR